MPDEVQVGDAAPPFELRHTMDSTVSLGELLARGAVLVLFYVFDFGRY